MKVLYVSELQSGSTAGMRMAHLQQLGHQVEAINTIAENPPNYLIRQLGRVLWQMGWPHDSAGVNQQMVRISKKLLPDIVWVDKGIHVKAATLHEIKQILPGVRLVHYNPDDPFGLQGKRGWRTFISAISNYDTHFVPRHQNIAEYTAQGARSVIHNIPTRGFDSDTHVPYKADSALRRAFEADVGFLGAYEAERANALYELADCGVAVRLMWDWPSKNWHPNYLRAPHSVRGSAYAEALSSFKIGLGFLRKANRDQHTSRSIEIPACGTFLLAERTAEHQMLFEEGKEADFFSSDDELVAKVKYYLENEKVREKIAQAGRERCVRSGYDYSSRMQQMLSQVLASKPQC